ncbi:MAG: hypothetical protein ACOH18_02580 [Candidatus Saccharimonadaceae bacterium]
MSNPQQMTTSATPEDDVIRPRENPPTASSGVSEKKTGVDEQSPSETGDRADTPKPKKSKTKSPWPRPTRAPKHDRLIPLSGKEWLMSWLLRGLVFLARVLTAGFVKVRRFSNPILSEKDRQYYELGTRRPHMKRNAVRKPRIVTVLNPKGGSGKTPTAAYLAIYAQEYTGNPCTLIDMNQNFGSTWRWVGVSQSDTITVYYAVTSSPFSNIDEFHAKTAIHQETGLRFIGSEDMDTTTAVGAIIQKDQSSLPDEEVRMSVFRRFRAFIRNIKRFSHSVFIDTGNGMSHASHTAAVDAGDVLVFPANWNNDDDIAGIQEGVHGYITRGYGPKLRQRAFYVVYGAPDLDKGVIYEKFCERVFAAYVAANFESGTLSAMNSEYRQQKAREYAENIGITIDRLYLVPWSKYIAQKHVASADIAKVGVPTSLAFIHVLDDIYSLNIDSDPAVVDPTADVDSQLALLYKEMRTDLTPTTA